MTEQMRAAVLAEPGKIRVDQVPVPQPGRGEVRIRLFRRDAAVVLEVEDRGCGVPEEIRGRIFDYLFTTKDIGQGTGLGLSIVHSLVTTHFGGEIGLSSQVGVGTTFTVTIPLADGI